MYQVNDAVLYGMNGVCKVTQIATHSFGNKASEYYVLKPVYTDSFEIFVPMENEKLTARMRRLISADKVMSIVKSMPAGSALWVEDDSARTHMFNDVLQECENESLVCMMRTLSKRREHLKLIKKKLHATDERFLKEATRLIKEEFAYALKLEPAEVSELITEITREAM